MRSDSSTVEIVPGPGLVGRFGDVVVFIAEETASTDRILGAVEAAAGNEHPGAAIAQRLAAVVFAAGAEPPPFAVVAPTVDGTLILVRGPVAATVAGAEGTRTLAGARAFTWVDEIMREPVRMISVAPDSAHPPESHPRTDLRAGVIPANGFVLRTRVSNSTKKPVTGSARSSSSQQPEPPATAPGGLDAAPSAPTAHAGDVERAETAAAPDSTESDNRPATQAMSLAWSQAATSAPTSAPESVTTHKSGPSGNRQRADRAFRSGMTASAMSDDVDSSGHGTVSTGPALLAADGTAYPLDRPYVVGRGPSADESVRRSTAAPIVLQRDRHISRVHAYVTVDAGKVYIRDAGTTSGTFLSTRTAPRWTRIGQSPTELPPGARVRISEQVLTYRAGRTGPES